MMKENNTDFLYYDNEMDEELFDDILLNSSYLYDSDVDEYVYEYEVDNVEDFDEQVEKEFDFEREDEIDRVFDDLLELVDIGVMLPGEMDELRETLKDVVFEALYSLYGISVYRPMYTVNDAGESEYTEYPYDKTEFKYFTKP